MKKNQKGFSTVEIILVLVILALVGGIGWYVWHNKKSANNSYAPTSNTSTTQAPQTSKTTDPYAGWKEYCSKTRKACFKYPTDWTTETAEPHVASSDALRLKGPKGLSLEWQAVVSGIGGACDPASDPHVYIHKVLPVKADTSLFVVETGDKDDAKNIGIVSAKNGKAPVTGDTGECLYYTTFGPKVTVNDSPAWLQGGWNNNTEKSDLANAELILQSFYNQ